MDKQMKMRELLDRVDNEIHDECVAARLRLLKERRREMIAAEKNLARMKDQFEKLLNEPVDDAVLEVPE